jgi:hypothetical protein
MTVSEMKSVLTDLEVKGHGDLDAGFIDTSKHFVNQPRQGKAKVVGIDDEGYPWPRESSVYKSCVTKMVAFFILLSCLGCSFHVEEEYIPCGYHNTPYHDIPYACNQSMGSYDYGECCSWITPEFYSECIETWCYSENWCGWDLFNYTCYPI